MSYSENRELWVDRSVTVGVPPEEVRDFLLDPVVVPELFPNHEVTVAGKNGESIDTVGVDTRIILARIGVKLFGRTITLDRDVELHVDQLETDICPEEVAQIGLIVARSKIAGGTYISSKILRTQEPGTTELTYQVYKPEHGGAAYDMPGSDKLATKAVEHELKGMPGRFARIRAQRAA
jgi:hypothetical protein